MLQPLAAPTLACPAKHYCAPWGQAVPGRLEHSNHSETHESCKSTGRLCYHVQCRSQIIWKVSCIALTGHGTHISSHSRNGAPHATLCWPWVHFLSGEVNPSLTLSMTRASSNHVSTISTCASLRSPAIASNRMKKQ